MDFMDHIKEADKALKGVCYAQLPYHMRGAVRRYIESGIHPGHFLSAVICNDLSDACFRADDINRHMLFEIVSFFYNEAPSLCWGSKSKMASWVSLGGLRGRHEKNNLKRS